MLKKSFSLIISISVLISFGLSGCAVRSGSSNLSNVKQNDIKKLIVKGKTTKTDIQKTFGEPYSTTILQNGDEQWTYMFTESKAKASNFIPIVGIFTGSDYRGKTLMITFNKKGVVKDYMFSSSKGETKIGF
jgi:outer membrane protein assembly factor BamE (lipoprotein component of BamABCDE complex)